MGENSAIEWTDHTFNPWIGCTKVSPACKLCYAETLMDSHGYVKVRVGAGHPLADPNGYAYEHLVVWVAAGRARPGPDEILHHANGDKTDNRLENLELLSRAEHGLEHHPSALTDAEVRAVRESYASGSEDMPTLARRYGVPVSRISRIVRGEARRGAGGPISTSNRGKAAAGRLLDGRTWDEVPRV